MRINSAAILLALSLPAAGADRIHSVNLCLLMRANIERVESWSQETKDRLMWECRARVASLNAARKLTKEESLRLRDAWIGHDPGRMADHD